METTEAEETVAKNMQKEEILREEALAEEVQDEIQEKIRKNQ